MTTTPHSDTAAVAAFLAWLPLHPHSADTRALIRQAAPRVLTHWFDYALTILTRDQDNDSDTSSLLERLATGRDPEAKVAALTGFTTWLHRLDDDTVVLHAAVPIVVLFMDYIHATVPANDTEPTDRWHTIHDLATNGPRPEPWHWPLTVPELVNTPDSDELAWTTPQPTRSHLAPSSVARGAGRGVRSAGAT